MTDRDAPPEHTVPLAYRRPVDDASTPDPGTTRLPPAYDEPRPWHTRGWVVGSGALVVGVLLGGAAVGGRDLGRAVATPARPAATVTVTASPTAEPTPATAPAGVATFAMPDESGRSLQDAQDDLQALSGDPLFYSASTDDSGQGRAQFLDADWQVCSQSVDPGTPVAVDDHSVSFGVLRLDEACP